MGHSDHKFKELTEELIGLRVSRPWCGVSSALFLELGELAADPGSQSDSLFGEACIFFDFEWRLESEVEIVCGSFSGKPSIQEMNAGLVGQKIIDITVDGGPPDIVVSFSGGHRLRSILLDSRDPDWNIRLKSGNYLSWENGDLMSQPGDATPSMSPEEREHAEWAQETAERWGKPLVEPIGGHCSKCRNFERIDGDFSLLDFGVCSHNGGPLDGRVVHMKSGCPEFLEA